MPINISSHLNDNKEKKEHHTRLNRRCKKIWKRSSVKTVNKEKTGKPSNNQRRMQKYCNGQVAYCHQPAHSGVDIWGVSLRGFFALMISVTFQLLAGSSECQWWYLNIRNLEKIAPPPVIRFTFCRTCMHQLLKQWTDSNNTSNCRISDSAK